MDQAGHRFAVTSLDPLTHRVVDHEAEGFWSNVPNNQKTNVLPEEAWTLAEALHRRGYETAAWIANSWIDQPKWGFGQGFDHFHSRVRDNADDITEDVKVWLTTRAALPGNDQPLFLYLHFTDVHFMDVHSPYQSNDELLEQFSRSPSLGEDRLLNRLEHLTIGYLGTDAPWKNSDRGKRLISWRAAYASGLRLFDDRLYPFLSWLQESGRLEHAVLVVTSDHGEDLLEHGRWSHGFTPTLFQHSIRIPLLVRLPGAAAGGQRIDTMTSLVDVMPTLLHMADRHYAPENLDGRILLSLDGKETSRYSDWAFSGAVCDNPNTVSIQDRDYKLIWDFPNGPMKLFNLQDDPYEKINLASGEPWLSLPSYSNRAYVELNPQAQNALRSIGYVR